MNFLQVNFESREAIFNDFEQIANKFCNEIALKINKTYYRIVDFEFYAYSTNFPDPQTHKHDLQLENAKFYLHRAGFDITFGDGKSHGGILIRGVVKLYDGADEKTGFMKKRVEGPRNVATEIFSNLNILINGEPNEISLIDIGKHDDIYFVPVNICIKTKRIGLTPKKDDPDGEYADLPLRYVVILQKTLNFDQKIKGIENLIVEEVRKKRVKEEKAIEILGYNKNFQ